MKVILTIIISYLIGCFSSAYFIGKVFKKIDIRGYGSGNAGATNALRVMGLQLGALTFVFDILKGIIAVLIGRKILGTNGDLVGGFFAVIGHNWPVFIKFKGGKGVATSIGALMMINFPTFVIAASIGLLLVFITRYVSLGSLCFLLSTPIIYLILNKDIRIEYLIFTLLLGTLSVIRHKDNIKRLREGNENKIGR